MQRYAGVLIQFEVVKAKFRMYLWSKSQAKLYFTFERI